MISGISQPSRIHFYLGVFGSLGLTCWRFLCCPLATLLARCSSLHRPPANRSGTYQSYLTRQPALLLTAIRHAEKNGYALGVKLVRGAYFVQERQKWRDEGREGPDPIWPDKQSTDLAFNSSVSTLIGTLADQLKGPKPELALTVFFGTHNPDSASRIIGEMKGHGLAVEGKEGRLRVRDDALGKIFIAQLFGESRFGACAFVGMKLISGMKDDLMDSVVDAFEPSKMPIAMKYIAYGKLSEVSLVNA